MAIAEKTAGDAVLAARSTLRRALGALMGMGADGKVGRVTQTALAAYMGMAQTTLSRKLKGEIDFGEDEIAMAASYWGKTPADLYDLERLLNSGYMPNPALALVAHDGQLELPLDVLPPELASVS